MHMYLVGDTEIPPPPPHHALSSPPPATKAAPAATHSSGPPQQPQSFQQIAVQQRAAILRGANAYTVPAPTITVRNGTVAAVSPIITAAHAQEKAATNRLNADEAAAQGTQNQLNMMDNAAQNGGLRPNMIQHIVALDKQLHQQDQQISTDRHHVDAVNNAANAKVDAANVVVYGQQAQHDQHVATASAHTFATSRDKLAKLLPKGVTLNQNGTLSQGQIDGLNSKQQAAYDAYLNAGTKANNDQARVFADNATINQSYAQLQLYASDKKYGSVAQDAVDTVNRALRPVGLQISKPQVIDPATARHNLDTANQSKELVDAYWNYTSAAIPAQAATQKVAALQKQVDNIHACLPSDAPLLQQLSAAQAAAEKPVLTQDVAGAYFAKVQGQMGVQQAKGDLTKAQGAYAKWSAKNPKAAAAANPYGQAVNQAQQKLALAGQYANATAAQFTGAYGQLYAFQRNAASAAAQAKVTPQDLAIVNQQHKLEQAQQDAGPEFVYSGGRFGTYKEVSRPKPPPIPATPAAYTAWRSADLNAVAAQEVANTLTDSGKQLGDQYQVSEDTHAVKADQQTLTRLTTAFDRWSAAHTRVIAPGRRLDGVPEGPITGVSGVNPDAAPLAAAKNTLSNDKNKLFGDQLQVGGDTAQLKYDQFLLTLPSNLQVPQTQADIQQQADAIAKYQHVHEFQSGAIDGKQATSAVQQDFSAWKQHLAARGLLQTMFTGRSQLEGYMQGTLAKLHALQSAYQSGRITYQQYETGLHNDLQNYGQTYQTMYGSETRNDGTWNTVDDVARAAVATAVGLVATGLSGGDFVAGFAAGFATYQAIDGAENIKTVAQGGNIMDDSNISLGGLIGEAVTGHASKAMLERAGVTTAEDIVSSAATAGSATVAGKVTEMVVAKAMSSLVDTAASEALGTTASEAEGAAVSEAAAGAAAKADVPLSVSIRATALSNLANQGVMSAGQLTNAAISAQANGGLFTAKGGKTMLSALKDQAFYLATAPLAGAVSGALPAGKIASAAIDDSTGKLQVTTQLADNVVAHAAVQTGTDFATNAALTYGDDELVVHRGMTGLDWITAAINTAPGTASHLIEHPLGLLHQWNATRGTAGDEANATETARTPDAETVAIKPATVEPPAAEGLDPIQARQTPPPDDAQPETWTPRSTDQTLVVGARRDPPWSRQAGAGEVHLDIDRRAQPDILSDIRSVPMIPDEHFGQVDFEHVQQQLFRETPPLAIGEAYRILKPNGSLTITTGSTGLYGADERATIIQELRNVGFTNIDAVANFEDRATVVRQLQDAGHPDMALEVEEDGRELGLDVVETEFKFTATKPADARPAAFRSMEDVEEGLRFSWPINPEPGTRSAAEAQHIAADDAEFQSLGEASLAAAPNGRLNPADIDFTQIESFTGVDPNDPTKQIIVSRERNADDLGANTHEAIHYHTSEDAKILGQSIPLGSGPFNNVDELNTKFLELLSNDSPLPLSDDGTPLAGMFQIYKQMGHDAFLAAIFDGRNAPDGAFGTYEGLVTARFGAPDGTAGLNPIQPAERGGTADEAADAQRAWINQSIHDIGQLPGSGNRSTNRSQAESELGDAASVTRKDWLTKRAEFIRQKTGRSDQDANLRQAEGDLDRAMAAAREAWAKKRAEFIKQQTGSNYRVRNKRDARSELDALIEARVKAVEKAHPGQSTDENRFQAELTTFGMMPGTPLEEPQTSLLFAGLTGSAVAALAAGAALPDSGRTDIANASNSIRGFLTAIRVHRDASPRVNIHLSTTTVAKLRLFASASFAVNGGINILDLGIKLAAHKHGIATPILEGAYGTGQLVSAERMARSFLHMNALPGIEDRVGVDSDGRPETLGFIAARHDIAPEDEKLITKYNNGAEFNATVTYDNSSGKTWREIAKEGNDSVKGLLSINPDKFISSSSPITRKLAKAMADQQAPAQIRVRTRTIPNHKEFGDIVNDGDFNLAVAFTSTGQNLTVPERYSKAGFLKESKTEFMRPGETFAHFARRQKTSLSALYKANEHLILPEYKIHMQGLWTGDRFELPPRIDSKGLTWGEASKTGRRPPIEVMVFNEDAKLLLPSSVSAKFGRPDGTARNVPSGDWAVSSAEMEAYIKAGLVRSGRSVATAETEAEALLPAIMREVADYNVDKPAPDTLFMPKNNWDSSPAAHRRQLVGNLLIGTGDVSALLQDAVLQGALGQTYLGIDSAFLASDATSTGNTIVKQTRISEETEAKLETGTAGFQFTSALGLGVKGAIKFIKAIRL